NIMKEKDENKEFLNVKEVSKLLNINEKKVYTLALAGKIPGTKVTGKWLFPKNELEIFLRNKARQTIKRFSSKYALNKNIVLVSGSDDPIMYMVQGLFHKMYPDFALFSSSVGSTEGLRLLKMGYCHVALSHLYDSAAGDYNFTFINNLFDDPDDIAVINLFYRSIGFVAGPQEVTSFRDIVDNGFKFINRQTGSGIRNRVDQLISQENLKSRQVIGYNEEVYTHLDVVESVLNGNADAGITAESVARYTNIYFHKLFDERFDMVIYKETFFEKGVQAFVELVRSGVFLSHLKSMKGYDSSYTGNIMYPVK
ncbi:MAG: helix-turn-helix transcriptional regulator, partial [Spirochaetes bacterium]|nr:helix-turn-helix transcriptional regulator [Spirochaetota bacterium]